MFVLLLMASFAQVEAPPKAPKLEKDETFEGRWDLVSWDLDGEPLPVKPQRLLVEGPFWREMMEGRVVWWDIARVASKPYPCFDRRKYTNDHLDIPHKHNRMGIYQLDGDELRFAYNLRNRESPAGVEPARGRGVEVYRRARAPEPDADLEGTWKLAGVNRGGRPSPKAERRLVVSGGTWKEHLGGEEDAVVPWKVSRDAGAPWPTIDIERWTNTGNLLRIEPRLGVYRYDGEHLVISYAEERPKTVIPGPGRTVEFYTRVKPR